MSTKTNHGAGSLGALRQNSLLADIPGPAAEFMQLSIEDRLEIMRDLRLDPKFKGTEVAREFLKELRDLHRNDINAIAERN